MLPIEVKEDKICININRISAITDEEAFRFLQDETYDSLTSFVDVYYLQDKGWVLEASIARIDGYQGSVLLELEDWQIIVLLILRTKSKEELNLFRQEIEKVKYTHSWLYDECYSFFDMMSDQV